jgi:hypothetical protein
MRQYLTVGGIVYTGVGLFLFIAVYLRGSDSAYTADLSWSDAFEVGLMWPWHLLQGLGIVG